MCRQGLAQLDIEARIEDQSIDICDPGVVVDPLVLIYTSEIFAAQRILGYQVEVSFDPERLRLTTLLNQAGTVTADLLSESGMQSPESGKVVAFGFNVIGPFLKTDGTRPLIGFAGDFIGDCTGETEVEISYISYAQLDEDEVPIDVLGKVGKSGSFKLTIEDKEERSAELRYTGVDTVSFTKTENIQDVSFDLVMNANSQVERIAFEILNDNPAQFFIDEVISSAEGVSIEKAEILDEGARIIIDCQIEIDSQEETIDDIFALKIRSINDSNDTGGLVLRPTQVSDCACVTRFLESSVVLKSTKSINTHVDYGFAKDGNNKVSIRENEDAWEIEVHENSSANFAVLTYNLLGALIYSAQESHTSMFRISKQNFLPGTYFLAVKSGNAIIARIKIIKTL